MIVEQTFKSTLGDFSLVRSVRSVPFRVFEDVSVDYRGQNGGVVALTLVRLVDLISCLQSLHVSGDNVAAVD